MRIVVTGTRGIPGVQGGVETHCRYLYPQLARLDCDVTVLARAPYVQGKGTSYRGVRVLPLPAIKHKYLEAFLHTCLSVFKAKALKPDILHVQAIGPSFFNPLARLLGLRVVSTVHGFNYRHLKWGPAARAFLRLCEFFGCRFANAIICISESIAAEIEKRYHKKTAVIPNGVQVPAPCATDGILKKYGLERGKYVLAVGRFVPEKGFHDLINSFSVLASLNTDSENRGWKLVIAGDADHEGSYSRDLKKKAARYKDIILTGFITGTPLEELYTHAGLFVLPSYYEGLPIVLLEAMSYGLSCIASDIPPHREVGLGQERLFACGSVKELSKKIRYYMNTRMSDTEKKSQITMIKEKYNWEKIARQTFSVYRDVLEKTTR